MYIPYIENFINKSNSLLKHKKFMSGSIIRMKLKGEPMWFELPYGYGNVFKYVSENIKITVRLDIDDVMISVSSDSKELMIISNKTNKITDIIYPITATKITDINFGDNNDKTNRILFNSFGAQQVRKTSERLYGMFGFLPLDITDEELFQYSTVYDEIPTRIELEDIKHLLNIEHDFTFEYLRLNVSESDIETMLESLNVIKSLTWNAIDDYTSNISF